MQSCLSARRLVFRSSQGGKDRRNKEMDRRAQQAWCSVHVDLLHCTSYNFNYSLKRKDLPLDLSWGRRGCYYMMVSVFLHHFQCICFWFLLGAGWNGLHGPDVVVENNSIVNSCLKSWMGLWGLCRMTVGVGSFHWRFPNEGIASFCVSVHPQLSFWDNNSLGKQRNIMKVCSQIWKQKRPVSSMEKSRGMERWSFLLPLLCYLSFAFLSMKWYINANRFCSAQGNEGVKCFPLCWKFMKRSNCSVGFGVGVVCLSFLLHCFLIFLFDECWRKCWYSCSLRGMMDYHLLRDWQSNWNDEFWACCEYTCSLCAVTQCLNVY